MSDGNGGEFRANDDAYTYPDEENVGYFNPTDMEGNTEKAIELLKALAMFDKRHAFRKYPHQHDT